jgi:predicted RNase H-like nuclease
MSLLSGLDRLGFRLWTEADRAAKRLVIECFPAEAIWAMKRLNRFEAALTATDVKRYKDQAGKTLTAQHVADGTRTVLNGFTVDSGHPAVWTVLVEHAIDWMCSDTTWCNSANTYRGGKLFDDVVDSMICLATSLSFAHGRHHVWQDRNCPDDGHIMGPGNLDALLVGRTIRST